ncbi:hypothetical protein GE09DRAFT_1097921 [Coniochaeta sp. 2T2.1]|nr:hypothetical protein GE09DRAFT_1097921 [Coniochaeta sp. 2T2.1]
MKFTRAVSFTNFFVATSALGFQVCVLYPWHKELDDRFEELKKEHLRVLDSMKAVSEGASVEGASVEKRKGIRDMINGLSGWRL